MKCSSHFSASTTGLLLLLLVAAASQLPGAESVTCNPYQLSPCSGAFFSSGKPSGQCCARLKEQRVCFCVYLKNPNLRKYVSSPNVRRIVAACGVSYPRC